MSPNGYIYLQNIFCFPSIHPNNEIQELEYELSDFYPVVNIGARPRGWIYLVAPQSGYFRVISLAPY